MAELEGTSALAQKALEDNQKLKIEDEHNLGVYFSMVRPHPFTERGGEEARREVGRCSFNKKFPPLLSPPVLLCNISRP